jgi:hypothetical protein
MRFGRKLAVVEKRRVGCVKVWDQGLYKLGESASRGATTNKVRDQQRTRRRVCGQNQTPPKCVSRPIKSPFTRLSPFPYTSLCYRILAALNYQPLLLAYIPMAPKPASTAGKAPASTASKAPAKPTEGSKAAKKTSSSKAAGEGGEEKKKRRKVRKETYSSYIYKGELSTQTWD